MPRQLYPKHIYYNLRQEAPPRVLLISVFFINLYVRLISHVGSRTPVEIHRVERGGCEGHFRKSRVGCSVHPVLRRI